MFGFGLVVGISLGLSLAILMVLTVAYYRKPLTQVLEEKAPRKKQKGEIITPTSAVDKQRERVREAHREQGIGLKIDDVI